MDNIFADEEQVIKNAEELISTNQFASDTDKKQYQALLKSYKNLLKHTRRIVKMSDIIQLESKNLSNKLQIASQTDALTGLYNRRFFNEVYPMEWKNAFRAKTNLGLLMIDVDFFKKYNDTYGHLQGDDCLIAVTNQIKKAVKRPRDVAARFGGEEFIVLMPDTDYRGAKLIARRILAGVESLAIEHRASTVSSHVTVSIGIACIIPDEGNSMVDHLNMVDTALYNAKGSRNCFMAYRPPKPSAK